jgi:phosphoribosyl 1,2-cyclic phosphodiesterase
MPMRVRLRVLASGSSGNAALVTAHDGARRHDLLIDLGLSPRRLRGLLRAEGTDLESLSAVLLTHGDVDHLHAGWAKGWPSLLAPPIVVRPSHGHLLPRAGLPHAPTRWIAEPLELGIFRVAAIELPHDSECSTGFRIECAGHSIGWVTDLGRIVDGLDAFLTGVRTLALESNYDPPMQLASPRPEYLKRRIMEGHGHLSNQQALHLVRRLESLGGLPEHVVLLHLSEQCNHPDVVHDLWRREAAHLHARMRVAMRREPTAPIEMASAGAIPA